jgi:hypothetical protein
MIKTTSPAGDLQEGLLYLPHELFALNPRGALILRREMGQRISSGSGNFQDFLEKQDVRVAEAAGRRSLNPEGARTA